MATEARPNQPKNTGRQENIEAQDACHLEKVKERGFKNKHVFIFTFIMFYQGS